jgi:hypothetical protein
MMSYRRHTGSSIGCQLYVSNTPGCMVEAPGSTKAGQYRSIRELTCLLTSVNNMVHNMTNLPYLDGLGIGLIRGLGAQEGPAGCHTYTIRTPMTKGARGLIP